MNSDGVTVAIPRPFYWDNFDVDDEPEPAYKTVRFDWRASLAGMRYAALQGHHRPLRFDMSPKLFDLCGNPKEFMGVPVWCSPGSFVRLVCENRTYELDLSA